MSNFNGVRKEIINPDAKRRVFTRSGGRCEWIDITNRERKRCVNTRTLQVHHLTYENIGEEWDEELMVCCASHHHIADMIRKVGIGVPTEIVVEHFVGIVNRNCVYINDDSIKKQYLWRLSAFLGNAEVEAKEICLGCDYSAKTSVEYMRAHQQPHDCTNATYEKIIKEFAYWIWRTSNFFEKAGTSKSTTGFPIERVLSAALEMREFVRWSVGDLRDGDNAQLKLF